MSSKSFLKNQIWLQALNWLIKPIWIFGIERLVQNQVGDSTYGDYYVAFNLSLLFAVLLDLGMNSYISREIAAAGRLIHKRRVLTMRLGMGLIYAILVAAAGNLQQVNIPVLLLVVANQLMASFTLMMRAVLQGRQRFIADGILSITDRLVAIIFCGSILWLPGVNLSAIDQIYQWFLVVAPGQSSMQVLVFYFIGSQFIGLLVACLLGAILVKNTDNSIAPQEYVQRKEAGKQAHFLAEDTRWKDWATHVFWFGLMAFAMSVFTRIDTSMIHALSNNGWVGYKGDFQAGLYAKSYRLLDAALIFSGLMSTQLLPMFTQKIANKESINSILKIGLIIILGVSVTSALVAIFFGNQILEILYPTTQQWITVSKLSKPVFVGNILPTTFKLLMVAFIPMALIHVFGTLVTALGKIKWLAFLALICVLLNAGLNFVLIQHWGAIGAAWGCLITQSVFAGACILKSLQFLRNQPTES